MKEILRGLEKNRGNSFRSALNCSVCNKKRLIKSPNAIKLGNISL